jgi:hypothetical protein
MILHIQNEIVFKAQNFNFVLALYRTILFITKIFRSCPISQMLTRKSNLILSQFLKVCYQGRVELRQAGSGWAGQERVGQSRAGQDRAGMGWDGLGRARKGWARSSWARTDWAGQERAAQGWAGQGWAVQGWAGQGRAGQKRAWSPD